RDDVATVGHLRAYRDLSESTNIDIGGSYARGHSPFGNGTNQLFGADLTLRWKPLRRAIYHSFVGRSEFVWARTTVSQLAGDFSQTQPAVVKTTSRPFGFYVSGDYQFARRWFLGGRFDRSARQLNAREHDIGGSLILTYWPSEFSQIRGQLRRTRYGDSFTANELLIQLQFSMGAHGAHPF